MRVLAFVCLLFASFYASAQDSVYIPGHTHNLKSKALLAQLSGQLKSEMDRNKLTSEMSITRQYRDITDELRRNVRDSAFLDQKEVQWLLDDTYRRIRESNVGLTSTPKTILAYRNPFPNAYCMGEGTFLVTTGLLSRFQNQSQLAAVLSHELAHYELNHTWKRFQLVHAAKELKEVKGVSKTGDPLVDKVRELQQLTTYVYKAHKEWELQADSLGFTLFSNAGFRHTEFVTMLSIIDPESISSDNPTTTFFASLNFSRYPFKEPWLRPKATIYGKSPWAFFLPEEVMRTHPQMLLRAEKLLPSLRDMGVESFIDSGQLRRISKIAMLESAAAGTRELQLDLAFHEILLGLQQLPDNAYMVTAMGRLLFRCASVKRDNMLIYHLPTLTTGYDSRMLLVYNFINNITAQELSELGYHFMNRKENFHENVEEHYFLLWKFCQLTERNQTRERVKEGYLERFPKGRYARILK